MNRADIKTMQEAATAEALRAVQSAAARWWSLEDIALQMRLSKSHVAQQIVCQPGFPPCAALETATMGGAGCGCLV